MHPAFFALLTHTLFPFLYPLYFKTLHFLKSCSNKGTKAKTTVVLMIQETRYYCYKRTTRLIGIITVPVPNNRSHRRPSTHSRPPRTGGKRWCTKPVHHKYIARKWTMYPVFTHSVHLKYIQNFPSQFPCNFPSPGNDQYIHSVPGHVTAMFPLGN